MLAPSIPEPIQTLKGNCFFFSQTGAEGGYWAFQEIPNPSQQSPYDELHILEDNDRLTIFSPENPTRIVWSGTISLIRHAIFTQDADGFWIHADQRDIERKVWAKYFFQEYPAQLTPLHTLASSTLRKP